jgi:hypothetical protein
MDDTVFAFAVTVTVALPVTPFIEPVTVVLPAATPLTIPEESIVATPGALLVQLTAEVTIAVELSLYVAVALNCSLAPTAKVVVAGDTARALSVLGGAVFAKLEPPPHPRLAIMATDAKTEIERDTQNDWVLRNCRMVEIILAPETGVQPDCAYAQMHVWCQTE